MKESKLFNSDIKVVAVSFKRNIAQRLISAIKLWNENRVAVKQLHALSDEMLRDIGIKRREITHVVHNSSECMELTNEKMKKSSQSAGLKQAA